MKTMILHSNINSDIHSLIETIEDMKKQLASVTERFDNAVDSRPQLKEYKDGKGLSS
jgi:hypothetical protein